MDKAISSPLIVIVCYECFHLLDYGKCNLTFLKKMMAYVIMLSSSALRGPLSYVECFYSALNDPKLL